jgi:hypothetical protein
MTNMAGRMIKYLYLYNVGLLLKAHFRYSSIQEEERREEAETTIGYISLNMEAAGPFLLDYVIVFMHEFPGQALLVF